jgi:ATP-binding cassette subfamily F protein uup
VSKPKAKTKLGFNEKREYESLEKDIELLEAEKAEAETIMNSGIQDYEELTKLSARIGELIDLIDTKTMRWMELDEFV